MFDDVLHAGTWGVRPILFTVAGFPVQAYPALVSLAIMVGVLLYLFEARRSNLSGEGTIYVLLAALAGGVFGAKLLVWLVNIRQLNTASALVSFLLSGRTVLGGLLGGVLGVWLLRRHGGMRERRGNLFVLPLAAALAIGRIGCFLRGCCYGRATSLSWGVNFGDGIPRHPTQLYEAAFFALFCGVVLCLDRQKIAPGRLFSVFLLVYLVFRFCIEFLREEPLLWAGLTAAQWLIIAVLIWLVPRVILEYRHTTLSVSA